MPHQGKRPDLLRCHYKNGVAHRRQHRRKRQFAQPRRRIVCLQEMDFDLRRRLHHSNRRILVEIRLRRAAVLDRDLVARQMAQPFDHRSLHFVQRAAPINDMASDVPRYPNLVQANATPLLAGARISPVGTPNGNNEECNSKFATNCARNSSGEIPAEGAKRSPWPKPEDRARVSCCCLLSSLRVT